MIDRLIDCSIDWLFNWLIVEGRTGWVIGTREVYSSWFLPRYELSRGKLTRKGVYHNHLRLLIGGEGTRLTWLCTPDKSLLTRYQKHTVMFNWSPCRDLLLRFCTIPSSRPLCLRPRNLESTIFRKYRQKIWEAWRGKGRGVGKNTLEPPGEMCFPRIKVDKELYIWIL